MTSPVAYTEYNISSDGELIAACQDGKAAAWDALVDRYERLVYTVIDRCKLEPAEEGAIFKSVWLSLLKNLDSLRRSKRIATWLVVTTRYELQRQMDIAEHENGDRHHRTADKWSCIEKEDFSIEDIACRYGRYETTCRAMTLLDVQSRLLLEMLYRKSTIPQDEEIAAKLKIPVDSIGPLQVSALQKLRQKIMDFT